MLAEDGVSQTAAVVDRCPCGRPWDHPANTAEGRFLSEIAARRTAQFGPVVPLTVTDGSSRIYLMPRCLMARHRFSGAQIAGLGLPELGSDACLVFRHLAAAVCARCGGTGPWSPGSDFMCRHCGAAYHAGVTR